MILTKLYAFLSDYDSLTAVDNYIKYNILYINTYMILQYFLRVYVILHLLNELGKTDEMQGFLSILALVLNPYTDGRL